MKVIVCLLSLAFLCSCSFGSKALKSASEQSIKAFAQVGKSTNCDILRKFKDPQLKSEVSNGKYAYTYNYMEMDMSSLYGSGFSSSSKIKIIDQGDFKGKSVIFIFDENNVLADFYIFFGLSALPIISKYQFLDLPIEPEVEYVGNLSVEEFLEKIPIGMEKEAVFRAIGKPLYAFEYKGEEFFIFSRVSRREAIEKQDKKRVERSKDYTQLAGMILATGVAGDILQTAGSVLPVARNVKNTMEDIENTVEDVKDSRENGEKAWEHYYIELKDNSVVDRYSSRGVLLTDEEKSCLGK